MHTTPAVCRPHLRQDNILQMCITGKARDEIRWNTYISLYFISRRFKFYFPFFQTQYNTLPFCQIKERLKIQIYNQDYNCLNKATEKMTDHILFSSVALETLYFRKTFSFSTAVHGNLTCGLSSHPHHLLIGE